MRPQQVPSHAPSRADIPCLSAGGILPRMTFGTMAARWTVESRSSGEIMGASRVPAGTSYIYGVVHREGEVDATPDAGT